MPDLPQSAINPPPSAQTFAQLLEHKLAQRNLVFSGADDYDRYAAAAEVIRDYLELQTEKTRLTRRPTRIVNNAAIECLPGQYLQKALQTLGLEDSMRRAFGQLQQKAGGASGAFNMAPLYAIEPDQATGNGGLGRLTSCELEGAADLGMPMILYGGLRYRNGFFKQKMEDGRQIKLKDDGWLIRGNPWEIPRPVQGPDGKPYRVQFGGCYEHSPDMKEHRWIAPAIEVDTVYDTLVAGERGINVQRLWAVPETFDTGDAELNGRLKEVDLELYPEDKDDRGRELRLMQEYYQVSLTVQDIVARHLKQHPTVRNLADTAVLHINDTHPALAVPELMRVLVDEHRVEWEEAKRITLSVCRHTNHTLQPEASEQWPDHMFRKILPRHFAIIDGLHNDLKAKIAATYDDAEERHACERQTALLWLNCVRMGPLAMLHSKRVNGVARMHTDLLKEKLSMFASIHPEGEDMWESHTNGIAHRRWLNTANPELAALFTEKTGNDKWSDELWPLDKKLEEVQNDPDFRQQYAAIKLANKKGLAAYVKEQTGLELDPHALFDVQVKRIHEYKRQFLNLLETIARYQDILDDVAAGRDPSKTRPPAVKIFAGKAAPSYVKANGILAAISSLAETVNNDSRVGNLLKVVLLQDYKVSTAQVIIPAADVSEQISTAGEEASGTGVMKMPLNGAVTIGTRDGATPEIAARARSGFHLFGHTKEELDELDQLTREEYNAKFIDADEAQDGGAALRLRKALAFLRDMPDLRQNLREDEVSFTDLANDVVIGSYDREKGRWRNDHRRIAADWSSYCETQQHIADLYLNDPETFLQERIDSTRAASHFSIVKTLKYGYADSWFEPVDGPRLAASQDEERESPAPFRVFADFRMPQIARERLPAPL